MKYNGTKNHIEIGGKILKLESFFDENNPRGRSYSLMILQTEGRKRKNLDKAVFIEHTAIIFDDKISGIKDRFQKGDKVLLKGYTRVSMYGNEQGGQDRVTEIVVEDIGLLGEKESRNRMELVGQIVTIPKEKILDRVNNKRLTTMLVRTFAEPREGIDFPVPVKHAVVGFNELSDKIQGDFKKGDNVSIVGYSKVTCYSNSNKGTDSVTELVVEEIMRIL